MADGSLIFDTEINTSGLTEGAENARKQVDAIGATALGNLASNAAQKIAGSVKDAFTEAAEFIVSTGSSFEASMSQVGATMGITALSEDYEKLAQAAKDMGAATKFSATEAGDALNYLALAGYSADEAVNALPTVLNVAAAGGIDLASASDMVTDSMSALGLGMDEMESFADKLAVTAQKSNTSVAQLGQAILTVGGTAKMLSGGVDEMNMALGLLADNGIKASEGGVALRNIITDIGGKTKPAREALEYLGVSAYDAEGKMRPLKDSFLDLNEALSHVTDQERTRLLTDIFGAMDLKAVNAMLGTSGERFDELRGYIEDCEGAASQMAETMSDNLQGDITIFNSALEAVGVSAYEKFSSPLRTAVQQVTEVMGQLNENLNGELGDKLETLGNKAGDLAVRFTEFAVNEGLPRLIDGLEWLCDHSDGLITSAEAIAAMVIAFKGFNAISGTVNAIEGAAAAFGGLDSALAAGAAGPWIALGTAVIGATVALAGWLDAAGKAKLEAASYKSELDELYLSTTAETNALAEMYNNTSKDEEIEESVRKVENYMDKLDGLVDENGNVTGSEEEVKTIIGEVNEILGTNLEIVDKNINGYKELAGSIDKTVEAYRRQAQIDYKKDAYGEAVSTIEEKTKAVEEALDKYKKVSAFRSRYEAKNSDADDNSDGELNNIAADSIKLDNLRNLRGEYSFYADEFKEYLKTHQKEIKNATLEDYSAFLDQFEQECYNIYGAALAAKNVTEKVIYDFEGLLREGEKAANGFIPDAARIAQAKGSKEAERIGQITASQQVSAEELFNTLETEWKKLDHEYDMGRIASDEELQKKRLDLLDKYGDETNEKTFKYYKKVGDFEKSQQKKREQEDEKRRKEEAAAAKKPNAEFTDKWAELDLQRAEGTIKSDRELYEKRLELLNEYGDRSDTAYRDYYKKLADGRSKYKDEELRDLNSHLDDIDKLYQKSYKELTKRQEDYRKKLMGLDDTFTIDTQKDKDGNEVKSYKINDIDKQIKDMKAYHENIKKLKEDGASAALLDELNSLKGEDAQKMAEYIAGLSDAERKKVIDLYNEKQKVADDLSAELYADEAKQMQDAFAAAITDLGVTAYDAGKAAGEQFANGFKGKLSDLVAVSKDVQVNAASGGGTTSAVNAETKAAAPQDIEVNIDVKGSDVYLDGEKVGEYNLTKSKQDQRKKGK